MTPTADRRARGTPVGSGRMSDPAGQAIACPACEVGATIPVYPGANDVVARDPLVACAGCGLVFQERAPAHEALDAAQAEAYGEPTRRFAGPVEAGVRLFRSARVRLAMRLAPTGSRVLDVGCGRGLFLRMLRERGYRVHGTELSAATAAQAYDDVPVEPGEMFEGQFPDDSFDLVSIWHVLEHLPRPRHALEICHRALAPGGRLLLAVPNFGSLQSQAGGAEWFHLDLPRHIFHFTPETLAHLLESSGYEIERMRTGQWEMDPFGWVQTLLNRAGLRRNGLYDTLRNNPEVRRDLSAGWRLALAALFVPAMLLALPLSLACRMAGRGGTIIAVARRRASL
jgi:2-polyprenyl-3-methyl-5-hydroxy-6-metoxy-1,4-benzoquinol methylase